MTKPMTIAEIQAHEAKAYERYRATKDLLMRFGVVDASAGFQYEITRKALGCECDRLEGDEPAYRKAVDRLLAFYASVERRYARLPEWRRIHAETLTAVAHLAAAERGIAPRGPAFDKLVDSLTSEEIARYVSMLAGRKAS